MRFRRCLNLGLCLAIQASLLSHVAAANPADLYVATTGNDAWSGRFAEVISGSQDALSTATVKGERGESGGNKGPRIHPARAT